jgi:hypothetical protein
MRGRFLGGWPPPQPSPAVREREGRPGGQAAGASAHVVIRREHTENGWALTTERRSTQERKEAETQGNGGEGAQDGWSGDQP